ncbi:MAG TPA: glycosyltransferase family 1 protein [Acidobacteriaceae bacterium]|jgi:glycosyltransferase involved in cell wall biosynthesis
MTKHTKLRVGIDCRMPDVHQGIGTAVIALAHALSQLRGADQEYTFVVREDQREWLRLHVSGDCHLVVRRDKAIAKIRRQLGRIGTIRKLYNRTQTRPPAIPVSDGYVEAAGFDVVHFPTQVAYLTGVPSIYQPWDLQHLHYPQFFSSEDYAIREMRYRAFCKQARFVCMQTEWSRNDVIQQYGLPPEKVVVVRWGSVLGAYSNPTPEVHSQVASRFGLPSEFFFYPAATWPHKNHEVILRALEILKKQHGRAVAVFFTGASTEYRSELERIAAECGVTQQVRYLGFVTTDELQVLFESATALIFASRFEGFGLPVLEAFQASLPVLCARASVVPEVAKDGALYFDPDAPEELARLMLAMLEHPEERQYLIERGAAVLARSTMEETAEGLRALYARAARS